MSKSIVGCLTGQQALDPDAPITTYVPEVTPSGSTDATVRHLLDMLSSWPTAQSLEHLIDTLTAFGALGPHLSASADARPTWPPTPSQGDSR